MENVTNLCFVLNVTNDIDLEEAEQILQNLGMDILYTEEEPGSLSKIYIKNLSSNILDSLLQKYHFIVSIQKTHLNFDWETQWMDHGHNFHEGFVHIDIENTINPAWKQIKLMPGAGFGDLSHPTTRLILKLMKNNMLNQQVIDVGCGSGVLALSAVAMGAKHVYAIDIDEEALTHAHENTALNAMQDRISFFLPENFSLPISIKSPILLMNMIMTEQEEAWETLSTVIPALSFCFTSGILKEQRKDYIQLVKEWNWKLSEEIEENGWLGFTFEIQK